MQNLSILTICLNKKKVYTRLHDEKHVLYNYVANILLDRIYKKRLIPIKDVVYLIASRRETNKFLNINFKNYLETKALDDHKIKISIEIRTPWEEKGLQAADFACWSIFRKYEHNDPSYYVLINQKIAEENPLFP